MRLRCTQCLSEVHDRTGYRSPNGEELCGPCYFALWGPKGRHALAEEAEARRPASRRPPKGRTIWIPGPTGETDPRVNGGRFGRRARG
jgi:hypothetical protein